MDTKIRIPVGLEKLLYLAADNPTFKNKLLDDWHAAAVEAGVKLRPSEGAILATAHRDTISRMIDSIVPSNPRRRRFMGRIAAAAASLAAGTVLVSGGCDSDSVSRGVGPGVDIDTDTDSDMDAGDTDSDDAGSTDTDTDTIDTDSESATGTAGIRVREDVDGDF